MGVIIDGHNMNWTATSIKVNIPHSPMNPIISPTSFLSGYDEKVYFLSIDIQLVHTTERMNLQTHYSNTYPFHLSLDLYELCFFYRPTFYSNSPSPPNSHNFRLKLK